MPASFPPIFPIPGNGTPKVLGHLLSDDVEGLSTGKRERLLRALYKNDVIRWAWVRHCRESRNTVEYVAAKGRDEQGVEKEGRGAT